MSRLRNWFASRRKALSHFSLFPRKFPIPPFIKKGSSTPQKSHDLESNVPPEVSSGIPICQIYTLRLRLQQPDLDIVGAGASGQVYNVDDHVVLKTCQIFEPPSGDASQSDHWHYASETLSHVNLLEDERTVLKLLQSRPHPHIMEAIDTDQPEGIYLRKYRRRAADIIPTQSHRIRVYRDITDALRHIHSLGIVHAEIQIDSVMFDDDGSAILCDFGAASPFGQANPFFPVLPLPVNGPFPTLSEASDMFAMASLIFQMEHGVFPELFLNNETLVLPEIRSGNQGIDEVIKKAWLGHYSSTSEMLQHLISIDAQTCHRRESPRPAPERGELFKDQIKRWRAHREEKFGKTFFA